MEVRPKRRKRKPAHSKSKTKLGLLSAAEYLPSQCSLGEDLHRFDQDKSILTTEEESRRRRTIILIKKENSWGFTLQTYGIRHKDTNEVEVMTYVDYIEMEGPAWYAGLRRGDVILAVDGDSVDTLTHRNLVNRIKKCEDTMRLVVLFADCCRKVELHDRYMRLKAILKGKLKELKILEDKEKQVLQGLSVLSRLDEVRASMRSTATVSSLESWDRFSMVTSNSHLHQSFSNLDDDISSDSVFLDDSDISGAPNQRSAHSSYSGEISSYSGESNKSYASVYISDIDDVVSHGSMTNRFLDSNSNGSEPKSEIRHSICSNDTIGPTILSATESLNISQANHASEFSIGERNYKNINHNNNIYKAICDREEPVKTWELQEMTVSTEIPLKLLDDSLGMMEVQTFVPESETQESIPLTYGYINLQDEVTYL